MSNRLFKCYTILSYVLSTILISERPIASHAFRLGTDPNQRWNYLDFPKNKYHLEWRYNEKLNEITFNVTVKTHGWILFGFARSDHDSARIDGIIAGVWDDGSVYLVDAHKEQGSNIMRKDANQNYKLYSGHQEGDSTFLSFSRLLDTCDSEDHLITQDRVSLVWGYGEKDGIDGDLSSKMDFGHFDAFLLDLDYALPTQPYYDEPQVPKKLKMWTITHDVTVPPVKTPYRCQIFKAPKLDKKHHTVGFEVTYGNKQAKYHLHHLIIYRCRAPKGANQTELFEPWVQNKENRGCAAIYSPSQSEMPTHYCQEPYVGVSYGQREYFLPENVGLPFGEDETEYYISQFHSSNPKERADLRLIAYINIFYTDRLRPIDGGMFVLGSTCPATPEAMFLPAKSKTRLTGHCSSDCIKHMFPEGIKIVAHWFHMHQSGASIRARHFRGDKELPLIGSDENYLWTKQAWRTMRKEVKIEITDQISVECNYDNSWNNVSMFGGFATHMIMCNMMIFYYNHRRDASWCSSQPFSEDIRRRHFGTEKWTFIEDPYFHWVPVEPAPIHLLGKTAQEVADNKNWSESAKKEIVKFQAEESQLCACGRMYAFQEPEIRDKAIQEAQAFFRKNGPGFAWDSNRWKIQNTSSLFVGPVNYPSNAAPYKKQSSKCGEKSVLEIIRESGLELEQELAIELADMNI